MFEYAALCKGKSLAPICRQVTDMCLDVPGLRGLSKTLSQNDRPQHFALWQKLV